MRRLTFSALPRLEKCAASVALPWATRESGASSRGTAIHAFLCALSKGTPRELALDGVPEEHRALCALLPDPDAGTPELAFAWNFETGAVRVLGSDLGRNYDTTPEEIAGSADLVVLDPSRAEVTDYKTGARAVDPAADNLQLGALALCVAKLTGARTVRVRIRKITEVGAFEDEVAELDAFALAWVEERLRTVVQRVRAAQRATESGSAPDVAEGDHCFFCPARLACPAKVAALVQLRTPQAVVARFAALLTEDAAAAYTVYERAEEALRTIRRQLYAYAAQQPIPTGDGQLFGAVSDSREEVDGARALAVLLAEVGPAVASKAITAESSKAAIERALSGAGLKTRRREVFRRLRDAGAITKRTTTRVRKFKEHTK
jgi:RecB family exonuclease